MPSLMKLAALAVIALVTVTSAHPGTGDISKEIESRKAFIRQAENLQVKCGSHLKARGIESEAKGRRRALVEGLRKERGLENVKPLVARDFRDVLNADHRYEMEGLSQNTPQDWMFEDKSSCLLQAEATEGPYYVYGEPIRKSMREFQAGVDLILDVQVINVNNCQPVNDVFIEFWSCNATGVYGGVVAQGNGNFDDKVNLQTTFLRGIQKTDQKGVVQMRTIFPGHYAGRTPHVHIFSHHGGEVLPNGTFKGTSISHSGQLFFDQNLIGEVEKIAPYNSNQQPFVPNEHDGIMAAEADKSDPVVNWITLGERVENGIVGFITVGINPDVAREPFIAAHIDKDGGHPGRPVY